MNKKQYKGKKGIIVKSNSDLLKLRDERKSVVLDLGLMTVKPASWVLNMNFGLISRLLNKDKIFEYIPVKRKIRYDCPRCNGYREVEIRCGQTHSYFKTCDKCNGKGYITK